MNPHLKRVRASIGVDVLAFCLWVWRWRDSRSFYRSFHLHELEDYVAARTPASPGSAARILREMRKRGVIAYSVRRFESRYTLTRIDDCMGGVQLELLKAASTSRER